MQNTPQELANMLARSMNNGGYEISDQLLDALVQEFTICAEVDDEEGTNESKVYFTEALAYAANRVTHHLS